jgi:hypothetical protein
VDDRQDTRGAQDAPLQPLGVLACVTTGFEIVARRPIMIAIPLILDLFLWLGPRLSIDPFLEQFERLLLGSVQQDFLGTIVKELTGKFNLFSALNPGPLLGVPSLMVSQMTVERPFGIRPDIIVPPSLVLGGVILLGLAGLGLSALYLCQVGYGVIDETESPLVGPGGVFSVWGRLVQLTLMLLVALLGVNVPLSCVAALIGTVLPSSVVIVLFMTFLSFVFFIGFHLVFTIPGIVQLRRTPLQAIRESFLITRADFLGAMGLLIILFVVSQGLNFVWTLPEATSWTTLIGLAGHAFISTALMVALFVFYQERLGFLQMLKQAFAPQATPAPPTDLR